MMARIIILGATGTLGGHVLSQAVAAGQRQSRSSSERRPNCCPTCVIVCRCMRAISARMCRSILISRQDALINCAGHVADGDAFVTLVDRLVTSVDSLPVEEQPTCWAMAGAALLDIGASRRRGLELPKVKATYWPHRAQL